MTENTTSAVATEASTSQISAKSKLTSSEVEKLEEAKLKAKYTIPTGGGFSGHSAFLQKKLAKGQKYFDSGDYQMARQTSALSKTRPTPDPLLLKFGTGEAIPTPESVPVRKTSIIQPKFHPAVPPTTPPVAVHPVPPTSNS